MPHLKHVCASSDKTTSGFSSFPLGLPAIAGMTHSPTSWRPPLLSVLHISRWHTFLSFHLVFHLHFRWYIRPQLYNSFLFCLLVPPCIFFFNTYCLRITINSFPIIPAETAFCGSPLNRPLPSSSIAPFTG